MKRSLLFISEEDIWGPDLLPGSICKLDFIELRAVEGEWLKRKPWVSPFLSEVHIQGVVL